MIPVEIHLQIDELVLHGFAASDRRRVGDAVERELTRLLEHAATSGAIPRALTTDGALASGDGGVIHLDVGAAPELAGAQVAQAIYRALSGSVSPARLRGRVDPPPAGSLSQSSGAVAASGGAKR
jgi:hypothetical protein